MRSLAVNGRLYIPSCRPPSTMQPARPKRGGFNGGIIEKSWRNRMDERGGHRIDLRGAIRDEYALHKADSGEYNENDILCKRYERRRARSEEGWGHPEQHIGNLR